MGWGWQGSGHSESHGEHPCMQTRKSGLGEAEARRAWLRGTVLTRSKGQTSPLGLLGMNPNHADTILLPSAKSGLFTPLFLRLHLNV